MSSEIATILEKLNSTDGIQGSLLITPDGMPVACKVPEGKDDEALAAVSSSMFLAATRSMEKLELGEVTRYVLRTESGRAIIVGLSKMILVVLTEKDVKIAKANVEIFQAANAIRKTGRLEV